MFNLWKKNNYKIVSVLLYFFNSITIPSFVFVKTLVLVITNLSNAFNLLILSSSNQFELVKQTEESDKNLLIAQSGNRQEFFPLLVSSISCLPVIAIASGLLEGMCTKSIRYDENVTDKEKHACTRLLKSFQNIKKKN